MGCNLLWWRNDPAHQCFGKLKSARFEKLSFTNPAAKQSVWEKAQSFSCRIIVRLDVFARTALLKTA